MLDINFLSLVARESGLEASQQTGGSIGLPFFFMVEVRGAVLFAKEEPVPARSAGQPKMFRGMNEDRDAAALFDPLGEKARGNAFARPSVTNESDIRHEQVRR